MKLTIENKAVIDSMSHYELLKIWRFAPVGDLWLEGETGEYWDRRRAMLRNADPEEAIRDSKSIGWIIP